MKTSLSKLTTFILTIISLNVFAGTTTTTSKVTISGEPVVVTKEGDVYTLPGTTTYTTTSDYYYLDVEGNKQVCYREVQSTFAGINPVNLSLKIGNDTVSLHCYTYSSEYFITK